jgi:hypothetical protein
MSRLHVLMAVFLPVFFVFGAPTNAKETMTHSRSPSTPPTRVADATLNGQDLSSNNKVIGTLIRVSG